jgi:hypothetical protein
MEGTCRYIVQAVMDNQQEMVLQLGRLVRGLKLTIKIDVMNDS